MTELLQVQVQKFIFEHEAEDEIDLLLKHTTIQGIPTTLVADQISGRRKAKLKLPTWYATKNIIYPPSANVEQCSSEETATFKVELLKQNIKSDFDKVVDLTGGFGVDSFFLSSLFREVDYIEPDENLVQITKHNVTILQEARGKKQEARIHHHHTTAEKFLEAANGTFSLVYIDPSRRTKGNQKIFRFGDCMPNITQLQDIVFQKADRLLVKASPMLDLLQGVKELKHVEKVFIVAVENECKEVLFLCRKGFEDEPAIEAVDLSDTANQDFISFDFLFSEEKNSTAEFSNPLRYLYEPNAAILKAGAFKLIANRFSLKKIQQHTHLYTSENLITDFPGRIFEIEALIKPDAKIVRQQFPEGKANVVTRNYPLSPDELKKKTGLKDGGEKFLIGFSGVHEKFVVVCSKVREITNT
jgi:hypothetical protein